MIFVILGSQKFQFNRLLKAVDDMIEQTSLEEPVFAQIGSSDYTPRHYQYQPFLNAEDFSRRQAEADIIITHSGTGAIINSVKMGKKVIVVPRLKQYGEHVDDHQVEIAEMFASLGLVCACMDPAELGEKLAEVRGMSFRPYQSNTDKYIQALDEYISSI